MTLLAELVRTSQRVAGTSSRKNKVDYLADCLAGLEAEAVAPAVAYLSGVIPSGPLGVGWATLGEHPPGAEAPTLTVAETAEVFDILAATSGPGSNARRRHLIGSLLGQATPEEQAFLRDIAERKRVPIEAGIGEVIGREVAVRCVVANVEVTMPPSDDLVAEARRIFGEDLVDIGEVS